MSGRDDQDHETRRVRARRRLRHFGFHLLGYFAVMIVLVPLNYMLAPQNPWFLFPLVAWGAPLAIHAAFTMGLLDGLFRR